MSVERERANPIGEGNSIAVADGNPLAASLVHHVLLWLFVTFFVGHLYLSVLDDIEEHRDEFVSMISGDKYEPAEEEAAADAPSEAASQ